MAPAEKGDMAALESSLKELNLTNEEMTKFEKAFKDPEFLKLFEDYAKEVSDPKVKAETDLYLRQLEQQGREEDVYGKGVQLVVPTPALVLKTKVMGPAGPGDIGGDGNGDSAGGGDASGLSGLPTGQKVFVNICTSDKVAKYSLTDARDAAGRVGKHLSIPLTLGPRREGTDKQGQPAGVYDFVVHPASVEFAANNAGVMKTLAETALEHVEKVCGSRLSRSWRRLNTRYKGTEGCSEPPVQCIRTAEGGEAVGGRLRPRADVPAADVPGAKTAPAAAAGAAGTAAGMGGGSSGGDPSAAGAGAGAGSGSRSKFSFDRPGGGGRPKEKQPDIKDPCQPGFRHPDGCLTPEWSLVHRGEADLAAAWGDAYRGLALAAPHVPKELVVRVTLPEVSAAAGVDLDVGERRLDLKVPGRYQLSVPLPHPVDEARGKAKFDKARRQLEITLPVVAPPPPPLPQPGPPPGAHQPLQEQREEQQEEQQQAEGDALGQGQQAAAEAAAAVRAGCDGERGAAPGMDGGLGGSVDAGTLQARGGSSTAGSSSGTSGDGAVLGAAAGGGVEEGSSEQQLTENERRWREIHARQQHEGHLTPAAPSGGAAAAAETAAVQAARQEGPAGGTAATSAATVAAQAGGQGQPAGDSAEPTVMLRPRLRSEHVMELD